MNAWSDIPETPRRLLAAWWILALVALSLATLMAVVLVAARTPFLGLGSEFFRTALVLHVDLAIVVWFLAIAVGIWVVAAPIEGRFASTVAWSGVWLAGGGVILALGAPWWGRVVPVLANYVPVLDNRLFLCGLGAFIGGVALAAVAALPGFVRATLAGHVAEWRWAAGAALVAFLAALAVFAAAQFSALPGKGSFEDRVWGAGHALQSVHTLMLMAAWLLLGREYICALPWARRPVAFLVAAAVLVPLADLWVAANFPLGSAAYRSGFTAVMRWSAWPPALALAGLLVAGMSCQRPTAKAGSRELLASIGLFVLGCAVGATIRGETTAVPAHYHGTVGAVTLAYMLWVRSWACRFGLRLPSAGIWKLQPFIYALGISLLVGGLAWSGWLGVPRKAPHVDVLIQSAGYRVAMGIAGIGGILAMVGAGTFVIFLFKAIWQKRSEDICGLASRKKHSDVWPARSAGV